MNQRTNRSIMALSFTGFIISVIILGAALYHKEWPKFLIACISLLIFAYWHRSNVMRDIAYRNSLSPDLPDTATEAYLPVQLPESYIWPQRVGETNPDSVQVLFPGARTDKFPIYQIPIFNRVQDGRPLRTQLGEIEGQTYFDVAVAEFFTPNEPEGGGILPYHSLLVTIDALKRTDAAHFKSSIEYLESAATMLKKQTITYFDGHKPSES